jgi:phosphoesterase RecJ-like protein
MTNWQRIISNLKKGEKITLLVHEKPDGDCLGSALALGLQLKYAGYQPQLYLPEPIPATYVFLPGTELINIYRKKQLPSGEPVIAVDCADPGRIQYPLPQGCPIINIDHHCSNNFFGDYYLVDPSAAATGEIIFTLLKEAKVTINPQAATCLYVAILADTGSFSYSNTTAKTFQIAAELLEIGCDIELIRENFFDKRPLQELLNIKLTLTKMQFTGNNRIVWSAMSYQELAAQNLLSTDTDSALNLMRSVEGVEAAIIFREIEPGKVKISFRSQKQLDVNLLAGEFGGGGHTRAAGCSIEGNLETIISSVIKRTEDYLRIQKRALQGGDGNKHCYKI